MQNMIHRNLEVLFLPCYVALQTVFEQV